MCQIYHHRGFCVRVILGDPEFEPIRATFPQLNCCAVDEHVPDIERYIWTVKDRVRSTYRMLLFKHVLLEGVVATRRTSGQTVGP